LREISKKTSGKRMIEDLFGSPSLPSVISDCYLFFKTGEHFFIDKVYVFDKHVFLELIEFGDLWVRRRFSGKRIAGYFTTSDNRINRLNDPSRIISNGRNGITYIIESVSFMKIGDNWKVNDDNLLEYCTPIRFEANDVSYVIDNKQSISKSKSRSSPQ
jgi:hypothetical protein